MNQRPLHGGRLTAAARQWGRPREQWLDLSTGINPHAWPVPEIPPEVWRRLPEDDDGLVEVIRNWAGIPLAADCLPVAGSQAAIQALPFVRAATGQSRKGRVAVPVTGYQEHGHCWANAGFEVLGLTADEIEQQLDQLDAVVWIQPNNPTGQSLPAERLLQWHGRLATHGGWLVVDEAFIGSLSSHTGDSLAAYADREGLVVLRSLGKFFGLAGVRAGAVLCRPELCQRLDQVLGPWAVSGPSRYLMIKALEDTGWQIAMARQLGKASARLQALLCGVGLVPLGGSCLFQYVPSPEAPAQADALAREGILVRRFSNPSALRFGLPGAEVEWERLQRTLQKVVF